MPRPTVPYTERRKASNLSASTRQRNRKRALVARQGPAPAAPKPAPPSSGGFNFVNPFDVNDPRHQRGKSKKR